MALVFDTSVLLDLERGNKETIEKIKQLRPEHPENICMTTINYSEFYYGCLRKSKENREKVLTKLDKFKLLNTTKSSSKIFAELKCECEERGKSVPLLDLLIASIVIDNNMTLVTKDKHFSDISTLRLRMV